MAGTVTIGWDAGGAHLKAAAVDGAGRVLMAAQRPCPIWQGMDHLRNAIADIQAELVAANINGPRHAITMTGEMADLFESRAEGVVAIAAAMADALPARTPPAFFAGAAHAWVEVDGVAGAANAIASANWQASAALVASGVDHGLFVDIGSTTTDVIPFAGRNLLARGTDDFTRMQLDELVYAGVVRTPLMALARRVPVDGAWVPLMAELFATTADVFRLTGALCEADDQMPAADGGAKTSVASARRLARMVGRDLDPACLAPWTALAHWLADALEASIHAACSSVIGRGEVAPDGPLVGAGIGRFLVQRLASRLNRPYLDFAGLMETHPRLADIPQRVSDCAPAVAVAALYRKYLLNPP